MSMPIDRSAVVLTWMQDQRWYGDKSRTVDSFVLQHLGNVIAGSRFDLSIADVTFSDGGRSSYFVPLVSEGSEQRPDVSVVDAFSRPAFLDWLGEGFPSERILNLEGQTMTWIPRNGLDMAVLAPGNARPLTSDQSNTSVLYNDRAIAKVFRRLRQGTNPDVEIIQHLSERTGYAHVPGHIGTVVLEAADRQTPVTMVAVQEYVANDGDGWTWLMRQLLSGTGPTREVLLESVELLGVRTAELHCALALPSDDSAFAPEAITRHECEQTIHRLIHELDHTMSSLVASRIRSETALHSLRERVAENLGIVLPLVGYPRIRVHGDYHLGQVLRTTGDFVIIDFEGEPSRSIDERREKVSPLKDVAGMLRSLGYAVASFERARRSTPTGEIRGWGDHAREAFLSGYRSNVRKGRSRIVPDDDHDFKAALNPFMVEKTLYEIRYELNNRPDWIDIPLDALEASVE